MTICPSIGSHGFPSSSRIAEGTPRLLEMVSKATAENRRRTQMEEEMESSLLVVQVRGARRQSCCLNDPPSHTHHYTQIMLSAERGRHPQGPPPARQAARTPPQARASRGPVRFCVNHLWLSFCTPPSSDTHPSAPPNSPSTPTFTTHSESRRLQGLPTPSFGLFGGLSAQKLIDVWQGAIDDAPAKDLVMGADGVRSVGSHSLCVLCLAPGQAPARPPIA